MFRIRELDFPHGPAGGILGLGMIEMSHSEEGFAGDLSRFRTGEAWGVIEREFRATGEAAGAQSRLAAAIEELLCGAYSQLVEPALPHAGAMIALGELGRGEVFPFSALEVAIVTGSEASSPGFSAAVAEFVRSMWDSGLRVNCTVRSVAECLAYRDATADFTIGLLDLHYLAGDRVVCERLASRLRGLVARRRDALLQRLIENTHERHARYRNTVRHSEPDVWEGPGGLRDLETIGLLAKVRSDYQLPRERLQEAAAFLASARFALHYQSGRDCNTAAADWEPTGPRGAWLREYFGHARTVFNETRRALDESVKRGDSLLDRFRDRRSHLSNAEFTVSRGRVFLRNPARLASDSGVASELAGFVARHGVAPAGETERRLEAAAPAVTAHWLLEPPRWPALRSILSSPYPAEALRALDDAGLLAALLPEWAQAANRVAASEPGLTVGERALLAIERLEALRSSTGPANRAFREMALEIDEPAVPMLALLLRGAGEGAQGPVNAAGGAAARLQMPAERTADLVFLIERQPELSAIFASRDVDNPATARLLAELAGATERLKLLTALTWADMAADSETSASWRLDQLWNAYSNARRELTRELETDRIREAPVPTPVHAEFIEGFPTRYLRTRSGEVEAHVRLYAESRPTGVAVRLERIEGAHRLTVIARDMPYLFASLAGAISSFGLNILKAEAFSNSRNVVLDTFVFADTKRALESNPQEAERLQDLIRRVALGKTETRRLLREPARAERKRAPHSRVRFDAEACETATLVEIETDDRIGLLFSLATAFSTAGCNIDLVLIDTQANRAIDVFYVSRDGSKLTADFQARLEEKLIAAC
jgi:[protein-PII] uridylyltransferase